MGILGSSTANIDADGANYLDLESEDSAYDSKFPHWECCDDYGGPLHAQMLLIGSRTLDLPIAHRCSA